VCHKEVLNERFCFIKDWCKKTAEGTITAYMRGIKKRVTLNWVIGQIKWLISWGLTDTDLEEILKKAETSPSYKPIQHEEGLKRLAEIKEKLGLKIHES